MPRYKASYHSLPRKQTLSNSMGHSVDWMGVGPMGVSLLLRGQNLHDPDNHTWPILNSEKVDHEEHFLFNQKAPGAQSVCSAFMGGKSWFCNSEPSLLDPVSPKTRGWLPEVSEGKQLWQEQIRFPKVRNCQVGLEIKWPALCSNDSAGYK